MAGPLGALLTAPLFAPSGRWTTRTVADLTGATQSSVARAWAQAYTADAVDLADTLPANGLRLVAATAGPGNSLLALVAEGAPTPATTGPAMRSPRRPPVQALLATELVARGARPAPADGVRADPAGDATAGADDLTEDRDLVAALREQHGHRSPLYLLTRCALAGPDQHFPLGPRGRHVVEVVIDDPAAWQGLLLELVRRCTRSPLAELQTAQHLAMTWARSGRTRFVWTASPPEQPPRRTPPAPTTVMPRATTQAVADDVLAVLLERITSGRLSAGERIGETSLARAVRASRSHVRDALRTLAGTGLVELVPQRGAVVPSPQTADVTETYAARRALGTLLVRRATQWRPGDLDPVESALHQLLAVGRSGDARATGEADLHLQDVLAHSTRMRRIPLMFQDLSNQLRVSIAVMGLSYTYSISDMCRDDTALLDLVRARDEDGAARLWQRKMNDAVSYMTTQLNSIRPVRTTPAG